jgi:hypothetical protein
VGSAPYDEGRRGVKKKKKKKKRVAGIEPA